MIRIRAGVPLIMVCGLATWTGNPVGAADSTQAGEVVVSQGHKSRDVQLIPLTNAVTDSMPVSEAIQKRRSVRSYDPRPLRLEELARLVLSASGITRHREVGDLRAAPSAGAIFPIELYVVAAHVSSLAPGLYHFLVDDSALIFLKDGEFTPVLNRAANIQDALESPAAVIILTADFGRTRQRYGRWAEGFVYIEAGAICENVYLQATALGLGTCAIGAFDEQAVKHLLGWDDMTDTVVLLLPVGPPR